MLTACIRLLISSCQPSSTCYLKTLPRILSFEEGEYHSAYYGKCHPFIGQIVSARGYLFASKVMSRREM